MAQYRLLLLVFVTKGQAKMVAKELKRADAAAINLEVGPRQIFGSESQNAKEQSAFTGR
ncbi:hypothetical protein [Bradyrhizobium sp. 27S5]|uniref:hypothetical protein n=1 Tax=Bradyrhizobium sp. 27S5 TaxID=3139728 RepID=UPI0030CC26F1